jgi:UDP-N-acetylmuramate--alanine ligase
MTIAANKIFFSGVAGSGMSALSLFMSKKGCSVAGSDRALDRDPAHPLLQVFEANGIMIHPQDGSGIDRSFDLVVFSTAVERDNPDYLKTAELGIATMTRPELLAGLVRQYRTIAVSGTSGKSTVAGMLAFLMSRLGMKPNFIGGGSVRRFRSATNPGNFLTGDADILIIEACESDGSIVNYRPQHSVILNLALDHHDIETTASMFGTLSEHTSGKVITNADDPLLVSKLNRTGITFSVDAPSDFRASEIRLDDLCSRFRLRGVNFTTSLPGMHNVSNAVAALAVLSELGIPIQDVTAHLSGFDGIGRRFEVIRNDRHLVIDDYAHNPHKIAALMATASRMRESICYVFQPHGFGPTRLMKDEYIRVFRDGLRESDMLVLLPIYYAGGNVMRDISSSDIAGPLEDGGISAVSIEEREELFDIARGYEACVVFGARDDSLNDLARAVAKVL